MNVKKTLIVVDTKRPPEFALAQQIVERDSRPNGNTGPELLPPAASIVQSSNELLYHVSKSRNYTCNPYLHYVDF
jgi:hypothetical protein